MATLPATSPALRLIVPIYARRASFLPIGIDRDHDLAGFLKLPHLVGDAGRVGFENGDRHALDVGQAQDILDSLDLLRRLALDAPHLDLGTELLRAVVSSLFRRHSTSRSYHW